MAEFLYVNIGIVELVSECEDAKALAGESFHVGKNISFDAVGKVMDFVIIGNLGANIQDSLHGALVQTVLVKGKQYLN